MPTATWTQVLLKAASACQHNMPRSGPGSLRTDSVVLFIVAIRLGGFGPGRALCEVPGTSASECCSARLWGLCFRFAAQRCKEGLSILSVLCGQML